MCSPVPVWQKKAKSKAASPRSTAVTSGSSGQRRPSCVFLSRPRRGKALVLLSTAKEKSVLPKTCLFMEMVEGWGENRAEETQKRKFWQDLIYCLPREMCYQRQESFSRPEQNMWSFKEFDLELKLLPSFLHYFIQWCFFLRGKVKGVVQ